MPSWEVHDKIAVMLGFDRFSSDTVNRLIDDADFIHDLGRRVPKLGLTRMYFDPESFTRISNVLIPKLWKLVGYSDLFYLHHAIDMMSLRMASALLIDCDIRHIEDCVISGILSDLKDMYYNMKKKIRNVNSIQIPYLREDVLGEKLRSNYEKIVCMKEFVNWVKREIVDPRVKQDKQDFGEAINALFKKATRQAEGWNSVKTSLLIAPPEFKQSIMQKEKRSYLFGRFFYYVNRLAALRSKLFDYVIIYTPYGLSIISEELFRSNRGLGKNINNAITHEYETDLIKKIVSQNRIISKLNEMPSIVIDTYVELILRANSLLEACLEDM